MPVSGAMLDAGAGDIELRACLLLKMLNQRNLV